MLILLDSLSLSQWKIRDFLEVDNSKNQQLFSNFNQIAVLPTSSLQTW